MVKIIVIKEGEETWERNAKYAEYKHIQVYPHHIYVKIEQENLNFLILNSTLR